MVLDYWQDNGRFWGTWSKKKLEGAMMRMQQRVRLESNRVVVIELLIRLKNNSGNISVREFKVCIYKMGKLSLKFLK